MGAIRSTMTGSRPPLRWRIFAVFMLIGILPYDTVQLLGTISAYDATCSVIDTIGVIGLTGYAFDRRIGPRSFWRRFAPVFIVFNVVVFLIGLIPLTRVAAFPSFMLVSLAVFMVLAIAVVWAMSLALLRYGGYPGFGKGRPPLLT